VPLLQQVLLVVAVAVGIFSVVLQAKRLAAKRGWRRVLPVIVVSLLIGTALNVWMVTVRLHRRASHTPPPTASAVPSPSNAP
jgi:hypothetical protein